MTGWPGAEAADYPDDEYELDAGTVMVFDLNLVKPTVFMNDECSSGTRRRARSGARTSSRC